MKNKRIVASLVAALSSFASSMAVGNEGNVESISMWGQANINSKLDGNKLSVPSGNKSRKSSGNKNFLGKKRPRSEGSTSPSGDRHGSKDKNSANGKQDKKPSKNSGAIGASKSLTGNKPVSLKSNLGKSPKSNTIIPNVPNGVTYGVGVPVLVGGAVTAGVAILSKVFKRSIFDKIKYGITVQGAIDYFKNNTQFVTEKVDGQEIALLELDLKNGKKMFVRTYIYGTSVYYDWIDWILITEELKSSPGKHDLGLGSYLVEWFEGFEPCANYNSDGEKSQIVDAYVYALVNLFGNTSSENSEFEKVTFSWDQICYIKSEIRSHIEEHFNKLVGSNLDLKILRFGDKLVELK